MALIRTNGKSSSMSEVSLWTNESPTTNQSDTTVTLSDNVTNYDLIKIKAILNTSSPSTEYYVIIDPTDWDSYANTEFRASIAALKSGTGIYVRTLTLEAPNSVRILAAQALAATGNDNAYAIVTEIIGITL